MHYLALVATLLSQPATVSVTTPNPPVDVGVTRPIDLVICLDTSNSMEDLLDSARMRLWDIVNELARMTPTPELRVGLVTYGSPAVASEEEGYVSVRSDLTDDLDTMQGLLMELTTDGGEELVGWALEAAVDRMSWSRDPQGLRLVFIAGNESADQGVEDVDFRAVAEQARRDDIVINALFAGPREQAEDMRWPEVARAGTGNFTAIDATASLMQVETPQDAELLRLNARLNETYIPYGERGAAGLANQRAQDNNATRLGVQSCSSRIVAKGTALYDNASWDLVDAVMQDDFQWGALLDEDLPEALRPMSRPEREAHVAARRAEREEIQAAIQELSEQRELFLREWRRERLASAGLDDGLRDALVAQATAKGFSCEGC